MAEYIVNTNQLRNNADQFIGLYRELDSVAMRLAGMQLGSILRIKASTALIGKVNDCRRAAANQADDLQALCRCLGDLADIYDKYERNLTEPKTQEEANQQIIDDIKDWFDDAADGAVDFVNWLVEMLGEGCGPLAVLGALFGNEDNLGDRLKNLFSGVSGIFDGIDSVITGGSATADDWFKNIFNLNPSGVKGWSDAVDNWIDSLDFGKQTTTAGKVGTICQWAGYAMNYIASGIDNYAEFDGDMSNARFWGETVLEGTVDVALGVGAGIAAAALLPATTPAIVVGAVGAVAVWGANAICEAVVGEDIAEVVSTVVIDGGKKVVDTVKDVGKAVADGAKSVWNGICDWAGGLF